MILTQQFKPGVRCPKATLEVVNARKLNIVSDGILIYQDQIVSSNGVDIAALNGCFGFEVNGKRISYLVSEINTNSANSVSLISGIRNRSGVFITPLLGLSPDIVGYDSYLYNTYLDKDDEDLVHLVLKYFPTEEYKSFEHNLMYSNPNIVCIKDSTINLYTPAMVIITMALGRTELVTDRRLFIQGKYSEMSEIAKSKILKFHKAGRNSKLYGVLYKTEDYRQELSKALGVDIKKDSELYDIPNFNEEILPTHLGKD